MSSFNFFPEGWKKENIKETNDILQGIVEKCDENYKSTGPGVPVVAQWLTNPTRNHEVAGSVPALAQWVNDPALP